MKFLTLKYYLKQDNVPPPPNNNIVKFPLLRLLQFLSDLKGTFL